MVTFARSRAVLGLLVAASLLGACSDDETSGAQPSTARRVGALALGAQRVAGSGGLIAAWGQPTYNSVALTLLRQDPFEPDLLLDVATIYPPNTGGYDLALPSVNPQWVAVAGGMWGPWVQLVKSGGPYVPTTVAMPAGVIRATAWNDRLVAVTADEVRLYDVTDPAAATLVRSFALEAPSTGIVAVGSGVFVFTTTGYGYVDLGAATYTETPSPELKGVTSATVFDGKLYVGGPSRYAGHYRIGRLDPSGAPALAIELANERIPDGNTQGSNLADFSYDPETGDYLVLAETEIWNQYSGPASGKSALLRFAERGGALVALEPLTLDRPACTCGYCWYGASNDGTSRVHVFNGRAYVVLVAGASEPLYTYALP
jgi:hypothetical protein